MCQEERERDCLLVVEIQFTICNIVIKLIELIKGEQKRETEMLKITGGQLVECL